MRELAWVPAVLFLACGPLQAAGIQWGNDPSQPQGGFGRPAQKAAPAQQSPTAVKPPAQAPASGPIAEPSWPQRFDVNRGERAGFGFVVGQPGRIAVTVHSQGAPLIVSLIKPGGATVDKQGTGSITVEASASADDVKRGVIWAVGVRAAQAQSAASGSVSVQHPPADMARAKAELETLASQRNAKLRSAPKSAAVPNPAAQRRLALEQEKTARHIAMLDQLKGKIAPEAYQRMSAHIMSRTRAAGVAPAAAPMGVALKASPFAATAVRATSSTSQADTGASPVGGNQPASAVAAPAISSLDHSEGDPGTPVMISGTGFSNTAGEVHFIVTASGKDVKADVQWWTDTQILASIPDVDGIPAFNGQMYVKRGSQPSKLVPFRFVPEMETRTLNLTDDRKIVEPYGHQNDGDPTADIDHRQQEGFLFFIGAKGDDEFFLSKHLKNGWQIYSASVVANGSGAPIGQGNFNASVVDAELRRGTDSPYVKVHWWVDAFSWTAYHPVVLIQGPKGMPHE